MGHVKSVMHKLSNWSARNRRVFKWKCIVDLAGKGQNNLISSYSPNTNKTRALWLRQIPFLRYTLSV